MGRVKEFDPERFVTVVEYARMCGVSQQAIRDRIANGRLHVDTFSVQRMYIDIKANPPRKLK